METKIKIKVKVEKVEEKEINVKFPCYTFLMTKDCRKYQVAFCESEKIVTVIGLIPDHNLGFITNSCIENAFSEDYKMATEYDWLRGLEEVQKLIIKFSK